MTTRPAWKQYEDRLRDLVVEWAKTHSNRPEHLYHYTTAAGLLGILRTQKMWATNSRFMNDPTEIEYATRQIHDIAIGEIDSFNAKRLQSLKKDIAQILDNYEKHARVYITCFCTHGDLLSQWRGYGALGGGYAVGVLAKNFGQYELKLKDFQKPKPLLRKVIYGRADQERFVRAWVRLVCEAKLKGQFFESVWFNFNLFLGESLNCYKDPAYEQEDEWRLIQFGRVNGKEIMTPDFRESAGRIVPYISLDMTARKGTHKGRLPIEIVRFGPTLEPRTTRRSVELACSAHGYSPPQLSIARSSIPFTG